MMFCSDIALIMEVADTSETSVNFYRTTRRDNPEDSHLHTRRRENLKSHLESIFILEHGFALKSTVAIREAFSNMYPDKKFRIGQQYID
jgi:hypothetical protein